MDKLIYNSSMPRAGSELIQCILHQNPKIYASSTSPLLEYQYAARGNRELSEVLSQPPELMDRAFNSMCKSMALGYYRPITNRPIVIDKNRGWMHYYEWVNKWNPNPKIICMIRDLRDIVASMEKIFRKNKDVPGMDNPASMINMTVDQRVHHWLNSQPIGLSLQRTRDAFERGIQKNIFFIRYEDLSNDPQNVMDQIYDFIGEDRFVHDFKNIKKEVIEDDIHFGIYGNHSVQKELTPSKPDGWKDVFSPQIGDMIKNSNLWYFKTFGYE